MKKNNIIYVLIIFCQFLLFNGCKETISVRSSNKEPKTKVYIGNLFPGNINDERNGYVPLVFMQTAQPFVLKMNMTESNVYLNILKKARQEFELVSVSVFEGTSEIAEIKTVDRAIIESFKASVSTGDPKVVLNKKKSLVQLQTVIPDVATLNYLFNKMNSSSIPFSFAPDGCYGRAHKMRQILNQEGYECEKLFAFAQGAFLSAYVLSGCCTFWGWHVAPTVWYNDENNNLKQVVIDPGLFSTPVPLPTWKAKLTSGNCPLPGTTVVAPNNIYYMDQPGEVYMLWDKYDEVNGGFIPIWLTDYSMIKTDCILNVYSNYSGCLVPNGGITVGQCFPPNMPEQ